MCVSGCMRMFQAQASFHLPLSPPLTSPLPLPTPRLQTATVSECSQNELTGNSDELTDEVWRTLCGSSDSCMCSMCVYISYNM